MNSPYLPRCPRQSIVVEDEPPPFKRMNPQQGGGNMNLKALVCWTLRDDLAPSSAFRPMNPLETSSGNNIDETNSTVNVLDNVVFMLDNEPLLIVDEAEKSSVDVDGKYHAVYAEQQRQFLDCQKRDAVDENSTDRPIVPAKCGTTSTAADPYPILVQDATDTPERQQRRAKRRRRIQRLGNVRFEKEDSLIQELVLEKKSEARGADDLQKSLHWSQSEKANFCAESVRTAQALRIDYPDYLQQLSQIYDQCGDKDHTKQDEFGRVLLDTWLSIDARGLENECCRTMRSHRESAVQVLLNYQQLLMQNCDEGSSSNYNKLLRRRSVDLSRRSRWFARFVAAADAMEAERIQKEQ